MESVIVKRGHGKDVPRMDTRTEHDVSGIGVGLCAARTCSALRFERGAGAVGFKSDFGQVPGGARIPAVSSGHDGGTTAVCQYAGDIFVASNRKSMPGTSGFHGDDGNGEAGLPDDQSVSITTFGGVEGIIRAGAEAVPEGGLGEVGTCGAGWDKDSSQCQ